MEIINGEQVIREAIGAINADTLKLDQNVETLSADKTLVITDLVVQKLDPGAASRDVIAPAEADSTDLVFWLYNTSTTAGRNLTFQDDTPANIKVLGPGQSGMFSCDGSSWVCMSDMGITYDSVAQQAIFPLSNDATTPTLAFGGGTDGVYQSQNGIMNVAIQGSGRWYFSGNVLRGSATGSPIISNANASATLPTLMPDNASSTTGVGSAGSDQLSLIAGGKEGIRISEVASAVFIDNKGPVNSTHYYWCDDFDDEAAGVQFESGLNADFWTTAGTNYAAGNVTYLGEVGGTIKAMCAAADNDSVTILGLPNCNTSQNPILEARIKIDTKETAAFFIGFADAASAAIDTFPNNCCLVGINSDNAHGFGATQIIAASNDDNAGVDYDDMGSAIVSGTFVKIKIDLTDTEQPRIWINDTEIAAGSITGTVKDATALCPYIAVQNLAGGAIQRFVTVDSSKLWQDRG